MHIQRYQDWHLVVMVFAAFGWQLFPVGAVIGGTVVDGTVTWTKRSDNCITSWATEGNL
jgi:hypothetical protein